jgi:hypothetical protein
MDTILQKPENGIRKILIGARIGLRIVYLLVQENYMFSPIPFWSTKRENANPILIHLKTSSTQ